MQRARTKPKYFVRAATPRTISSEVTDYNQIALDHAGICEGLHRIDPSWWSGRCWCDGWRGGQQIHGRMYTWTWLCNWRPQTRIIRWCGWHWWWVCRGRWWWWLSGGIASEHWTGGVTHQERERGRKFGEGTKSIQGELVRRRKRLLWQNAPNQDRKYSVIAKGDLLHITCRTIILQPNLTRNRRYKDTDGILNWTEEQYLDYTEF